MLVGWARGKYGVKAPAVTGHETFDRYFRVHQNTLELLVAFVPAIWLFGMYVDPTWAALLGLVFIVARMLYLRGYVRDPAKREVGFTLSVLPILVLLVGGLWGAGRGLL
jgi:uncharacterized membrane protein YecN with MAPEG domain